MSNFNHGFWHRQARGCQKRANYDGLLRICLGFLVKMKASSSITSIFLFLKLFATDDNFFLRVSECAHFRNATVVANNKTALFINFKYTAFPHAATFKRLHVHDCAAGAITTGIAAVLTDKSSGRGVTILNATHLAATVCSAIS